MSELRETYPVGAKPRLDVTSSGGDLVVAAGPAGQIVLAIEEGAEGYRVEMAGDTLLVHQERGWRTKFRTARIHVRAPEGITVVAKTTSGDITATVALGDADISSVSGDVRLRDVGGSAQLKTASGDIEAEIVGRDLMAASASGSIRVGHARGDTNLSTASGDIAVSTASGSVKLQSASGDMSVRTVEGPSVAAKNMSGDLKLGIPPRRRVDFDVQSLSGEMRTDLPDSDGSPPEKTLKLRVKSVSGDVLLVGG